MKKCLLLTAVVFFGTFTAAIAQVPSYVPADGLVGWWPFNGNANDESGNGNDGTVNGATLTEDRFGNAAKAYSFNGVNNNIEVPSSNELNFGVNPSFSISLWMYSLAPTFNGIICKADPLDGFGWNGWNLVYNDFQTGYPCLGNTIASNPSEWNHLAFTISSGQISMYLNGQYYNQYYCNEIVNNSISSTHNMFIGVDRDGSNFFTGQIDDIAIYNRALTEQEIQSLYIGCNVAPTTIAGNLSPATLTSTSYACNNNPGSTYQWTVTNGVITAGQGTSNVTVLWGEEGTGTLSVVETNAEGCSGATSTIEVTVVCATTATTIDGPLGPNALTSTTYTCNGVAGSSYQWSISNGVITSGQGTNSVTVLWAGTGLGTISVQETTNANCEGDVISLDVVVIPTSVEEEQDLSIAIFPNPASNEVTLTASEGLRGKIYTIFSSTGQVVMTGALSSRTVIDLQGLASGTYTVVVDGAVRKTLSVVQE